MVPTETHIIILREQEVGWRHETRVQPQYIVAWNSFPLFLPMRGTLSLLHLLVPEF